MRLHGKRMTAILQRFHDSGIRFEIYNLVKPSKPSFYWRLACSLGLPEWEDGWTATIDEAIQRLAAAVVKRYPDSEFAKAERA